MTSKATLNVKDSSEFQEFVEIRNLAEGSVTLYENALNKYINFVGKNLDELIEEAEEEEDAGIRMRKRKVKNYLTTFKMHLKKQEYSDAYIQQIMVLVKAYYNENDIMLPMERRKVRIDKKPVTIDDLPTMEEIQDFMRYSKPIYQAMTTIMLSSGMSRAEICSLTFEHLYKAVPFEKYPKTMEELIENLETHQDTILFWNIIRIKTKNHYFTFSSPESVINLTLYLKDLNRLRPEYNPEPSDQLFRNRSDSISPKSMSEMFRHINKKAGLRKVNGKIVVRPHSLRKYFATTLEKNKMPHLSTRWLMGHTIDNITSSYFYADPETLRADYIEVLDQLQTNKVQTVIVNQYEEVRHDLDKVIENQKKFSLLIESGNLPEEIRDYVLESVARGEVELEKRLNKMTDEEYLDFIGKSEDPD